MNVERLEKLAETVKEGIIRFDNYGLVVVFNMAHEIIDFTQAGSWVHGFSKPERPDTRGKLHEVNCAACLAGVAVMMFGGFEKQELEAVNCPHEARILLDLDRNTADELFWSNLAPDITGPQAARVINKLLLTEKVDWFSILYLS